MVGKMGYGPLWFIVGLAVAPAIDVIRITICYLLDLDSGDLFGAT